MNNKPEYTRLLPHYHPVGATFFVTFRLADSLPRIFLDRLNDWYQAEQDSLATQAPSPQVEANWNALHRAYFRHLDRALDQCLAGPTFLKQPRVADCVRTQLVRFDGIWYRLWAYTLMPNHVHCLLDFSIQINTGGNVQLTDYQNLDVVLRRIKGASARYANQVLRRTNQAFWQPEYHDRYIRDKLHLRSAVDYIKHNPVSAGLCQHWHEHLFTWVHEDLW